ncbi:MULTISPECIES: hypothetical protein [Mycolicibacter]|uniref:Uncharacterized protein n=1 Tax=Mycolicibacter longobardus TaxID=1108812 RepID=A0A1X1YAI9_9MYCO|nr:MULTISPECIES: hypothetical protein [Mycolicibacter]ORW08127.1 hypothetical protein AWC16_20585 [Mycolicibacter longobardus]RAV04247.1 hypothetical protein DQP56_00040 [Mycolicibacter senuensis]
MTITTYSRGDFTLTADDHCGSDQVTLTVTRTAPFTDDGVRRLNNELADYGAELIAGSVAGRYTLYVGSEALDYDPGTDASAVLTATVPR